MRSFHDSELAHAIARLQHLEDGLGVEDFQKLGQD